MANNMTKYATVNETMWSEARIICWKIFGLNGAMPLLDWGVHAMVASLPATAEDPLSELVLMMEVWWRVC